MLVVDDDPLSRALQVHLAALLGYTATAEPDAEQALARAVSGEIDAMLLDLGMPGLDGFEVLRRLRAREAQAGRPPLPVIAVTGYASEVDRQRCLRAGFIDYVPKPVQAAALGAALARAVSSRCGEATTRAVEHASDAMRLRATVRRLSGVKPGDRQFTPTVTESFALRSAQLIEMAHAGVQQADAGQVGRAARALRASAEFLGALRLAQMAGALAERAALGAWPEAQQTLQDIEQEHQAVLTLLFEAAR